MRSDRKKLFPPGAAQQSITVLSGIGSSAYTLIWLAPSCTVTRPSAKHGRDAILPVPLTTRQFGIDGWRSACTPCPVSSSRMLSASARRVLTRRTVGAGRLFASSSFLVSRSPNCSISSAVSQRGVL